MFAISAEKFRSKRWTKTFEEQQVMKFKLLWQGIKTCW